MFILRIKFAQLNTATKTKTRGLHPAYPVKRKTGKIFYNISAYFKIYKELP